MYTARRASCAATMPRSCRCWRTGRLTHELPNNKYDSYATSISVRQNLVPNLVPNPNPFDLGSGRRQAGGFGELFGTRFGKEVRDAPPAPPPDPTRLQQQLERDLQANLADLPTVCDWGCKKSTGDGMSACAVQSRWRRTWPSACWLSPPSRCSG